MWLGMSSLANSTGKRILPSTERHFEQHRRLKHHADIFQRPVHRFAADGDVPEEAGSRPETIFSSVLLPQPLGPTMETKLPA